MSLTRVLGLSLGASRLAGCCREGLAGFIGMKGTLDLKVTRVLEAGGLALVVRGVVIYGNRARRQTGEAGRFDLRGCASGVKADGSWRFVIDNPWGTD